MLLQKINENHKDRYDFFYLPIDFKVTYLYFKPSQNKCNVGYAFINFVSSLYILKFFEEFNGNRWECFNSEKICEITYGRIQGKSNLIEHFESSTLWHQSDRKVKPLILNVPVPNASFLDGYKKHLLFQFGNKEESQVQFQKKNDENNANKTSTFFNVAQ